MSEVGRIVERAQGCHHSFLLEIERKAPGNGGFVLWGDVVRCGGERVPALGHEG